MDKGNRIVGKRDTNMGILLEKVFFTSGVTSNIKIPTQNGYIEKEGSMTVSVGVEVRHGVGILQNLGQENIRDAIRQRVGLDIGVGAVSCIQEALHLVYVRVLLGEIKVDNGDYVHVSEISSGIGT